MQLGLSQRSEINIENYMNEFFLMQLLDVHDNLNLNTWLNADRCDLLHNFLWALQINDTLVDAHLEAIPSLRAYDNYKNPM